MLKKFRTLIIIVVLAAVGSTAFWFYRQQNTNADSQWQTAAAVRGRLTATVGATGVVRANQTATLTWQTSGRVGQVYVKVGDVVAVDAVLAELSKSSLAQSIILAEADLVNARRALENLKQSGTARAQAQVAVANAQRAYNDAKQKYQGIAYQRGTPASIEKTEADLKLAENQVANASRFYDALAALPDDNPDKAQAKSVLNAAILNRDRLRATLNYLTGKPSTQDGLELEARYLLAEAQLADAQREWDRLKDGPDPDDIAAAEARVAAIEATLALSTIKAPFAGTITQAQPMIGDQVTPGAFAFRIDDLSRLLVDVRVSEIDINNIKPGQQVTLSFDAILNSEYKGVVVEVDPVGTQGAGVIDFAVTVELTNPDGSIRPGMTAAVNILVNELQDVLLVPNRAVRFVEGKRVVYVLRGDTPEPVTVILGASSDLTSEVIGGDLKEGDLIVLNPPTSFNGPGGGPFGP